MAKVTGPLLSFSARGSIGKAIVASNWKGVKYMRQHVIPANPRTTAQQAVRRTFALLREMFKLAPAIVREPWDAHAQGRPLTGMNKYVGENTRVLNGEADMALFIGSPGAKGGLPPDSMALSIAGGAGEILATFVVPDEPTGWTLTAAQAMAFKQQAPDAIFTGPILAGEDVAAPYEVEFTGLDNAFDYVVAGWLKWEKPDGTFAYSVGLTDTASPT